MRKNKDYGAKIRVWDNGGKTIDRYTLLPPRTATAYKEKRILWEGLGASENPFLGFGMHISARAGSHLGKRIHWDNLPLEVKKFALQSYPEFCGVI